MPLDLREPLVEARGFSFCESVFAGPKSPWHLRKLNPRSGQKFSGGIDTKFLCREQHVNGWDLEVPITEHHLNEVACKKCLAEFVIQTGYKPPE